MPPQILPSDFICGVFPFPSSLIKSLSFSSISVCFHVLIQNGITYLCVADMDFGASKPFAFLTNISSDFSSRYGDRALTAQAYEMNNDFSRILGKQMVRLTTRRRRFFVSIWWISRPRRYFVLLPC